MASEITDILVDFSIFDVNDIVDFIKDEKMLKEKIDKAKELMRK